MTKERIRKVKKLGGALGLSASIFVVMMGFQNCASEHSNKGSSSTSSTPTVDQLLAGYEAASKAIFAESCASCHSSDSLVTVPFASFETAFLIQNGYIVPGEPQNSPLYLAVLDGLMPHDSQGSLSSAELETLRDWIFTLGDPSGSGGIIAAPGDEGGGGGGPGVPTFSGIFATILSTNCTSCHRAGSASAGVRLDTYAEVMKYVVLSNPRSSPLYSEINGGFMPRPTAFPQPTRDRYAASILEWIEAGAPNN